LGWKLAAVLQGWAGERLLPSYTEDRLPVFRSTAVDFIEAFVETDKAFLAQYDPAQNLTDFEQAWAERASGDNAKVFSFEPHYEGSSIVYGLLNCISSARGSHQYRARIGHHLPPQLLSSGKNIFEELGDGFTLLALGASEDVVAAFAQSAQALPVPLKIIRDTLADGRKAYEASLILIRPDQFVAWCGDHPDNVEAMMRKVVGYKVS
jgi:hypothetical protein